MNVKLCEYKRMATCHLVVSNCLIFLPRNQLFTANQYVKTDEKI